MDKPLVLDSKGPFVDVPLGPLGSPVETDWDPTITFTFKKSEWDRIHNLAGLGELYLKNKGWTEDKRPDLAKQLREWMVIVNWLLDYKL